MLAHRLRALHDLLPPCGADAIKLLVDDRDEQEGTTVDTRTPPIVTTAIGQRWTRAGPFPPSRL